MVFLWVKYPHPQHYFGVQVLVEATVGMVPEEVIAQTVDKEHDHVACLRQWLRVEAFQDWV